MTIGKLWRPETFQGAHRSRDYFEGWYFKLIDQSRRTVLAVIPGVAIGKSKQDSHAFIQLIDAVSGKTEYFRFPFSDFSADKRRFDVYIGANHFSDQGVEIDLENESTRISCRLRFDHIEKYPWSFFNPGIMGPFSFMPGMECYHGIVNISHTISGTLFHNGEQIDMTGGEGYIEKDWGRSFPESWIWMQANHFETRGTSFLFSVAQIPWLGRSFTGLISFLKTPSGFYRFATYNGAAIQRLRIAGNRIEASIKGVAHTLAFTAAYARGGILKAPKNGMMHREIEESITAEVNVTLTGRTGNTIFTGSSNRVGMELSDAGKFLV
ncbi:MAG: tocopherol cyclase family protein [Clostridiaceae bacterium]